MDYGKSIKFPLDDPSWVTKVIIGIVIGFIPIVNFAQQGYGLEIIRRVARGEEEELPAWDNFGSYIVQGLAVSVAVLSLIHISEPTRLRRISYAVFCLKKKNKKRFMTLHRIHINK